MAAPKEYRFHTLAWREVEETDVWYLSRDYDTSVDFLRDLDAALEAISVAPQRRPKYLHGTRRLLCSAFPFPLFTWTILN